MILQKSCALAWRYLAFSAALYLVLRDAVLHYQNMRTYAPHFKNIQSPLINMIFRKSRPNASEETYRVTCDDNFFRSLQQIVFGHAFEKLRPLAIAKYGHRRN